MAAKVIIIFLTYCLYGLFKAGQFNTLTFCDGLIARAQNHLSVSNHYIWTPHIFLHQHLILSQYLSLYQITKYYIYYIIFSYLFLTQGVYTPTIFHLHIHLVVNISKYLCCDLKSMSKFQFWWYLILLISEIYFA
jgi:hypothetical protein